MVEDKRSRFIRNLKGGPHGVGDPNDTSLRKVEESVLIPQKMRDKAKQEKCAREVEEFSKCCKNTNVFMVFMCRKPNSALKACLETWFNNPEFKKECTEEYIQERSEYRRTGIPKVSKNSRAMSSS